MASIWKHPKPKYFMACSTSKDGKRLKFLIAGKGL